MHHATRGGRSGRGGRGRLGRLGRTVTRCRPRASRRSAARVGRARAREPRARRRPRLRPRDLHGPGRSERPRSRPATGASRARRRAAAPCVAGAERAEVVGGADRSVRAPAITAPPMPCRRRSARTATASMYPAPKRVAAVDQPALDDRAVADQIALLPDQRVHAAEGVVPRVVGHRGAEHVVKQRRAPSRARPRRARPYARSWIRRSGPCRRARRLRAARAVPAFVDERGDLAGQALRADP